MGYNLQTRCVTHGESAYIFRGKEAQSIRLWMARHRSRDCVVEWAVDNTYSTPEWADAQNDLALPDDLGGQAAHSKAAIAWDDVCWHLGIGRWAQ
jgi:hypothetical protein